MSSDASGVSGSLTQPNPYSRDLATSPAGDLTRWGELKRQVAPLTQATLDRITADPAAAENALRARALAPIGGFQSSGAVALLPPPSAEPGQGDGRTAFVSALAVLRGDDSAPTQVRTIEVSLT